MRTITYILFLTILTSCSTLMNNPKAIEAALLASKALTISEKEVMAMTSEFMQKSDKENVTAAGNNKYSTRLKRITDKFSSESGLNFKVYITPDINAFATADGSIRVYSGLMDVMTDDELAAIIGHEIGHVRNNDVKDAMKNAYLTAAATSAIGATSNSIASLTDSQLGKLAGTFIGAQYSQKQELEADDYSFEFIMKNGYDPYAMARALEKINAIASEGGTRANNIAQLFSSHPDSKFRAARMREKAEKYKPQQKNTSTEWSF